MPFTVTMPKLSPTMDEGTIAKWHKKEGEFVDAGDLLLEISTDKATVEHNALDPGWLRKVLIKEGESAIVNQPIAIFTEKKEESINGYQPEGEMMKKEAPKATATVASEKQEAAPAKTQMMQPTFAPEAPLKEGFAFPREPMEGRAKASPLAKKLAKEKGLDLSSVEGTGPNKRIMSRDLDLAQTKGKVSFAHREVPSEPAGSYEEEALTPMRKVIAQRMQEAKTFIPHIYVTQEVNAIPFVQIREQLAQGDLSISFNDLFIRACALALREHPMVNSGFHSGNHTIIRFKTIDISVAVNVPAGLITPIIRHADYKSVGEISVEIRELARRAKEGKLEAHEYRGGSFTLSNMGMYGITDFQAIINPPQAAILAVGGIQEKPVVKDGEIAVGKTVFLTLSVDHRVVDGAAASFFLKTLKIYIENPALLLI